MVVGEDERRATYNPILVLGFDDDHRTAESVRTPVAGAVHCARPLLLKISYFHYLYFDKAAAAM